MKARLIQVWDAFRGGFWFFPAVMVAAAIVAGFAMPVLDQFLGDWSIAYLDWIKTTATSARNSLPLLASAMITVAGVVFSITIVALSITSSQFGSRILRNFMADRVTHVTIGSLLGTSVYCILVLRDISTTTGQQLVPNISVFVALVLSLTSIGVLIYFVHHVGLSVQAQHIVSRLAQEFDASMEAIYPQQIGQSSEDAVQAANLHVQWQRLGDDASILLADCEGYIQGFDQQRLLHAAQSHDVVIELLRQPGDFLEQGSPLARVWPAGDDEDSLSANLNEAVLVGSIRTPRQDVECSAHELVEIAVRAHSPGINDPYTASACIDRLAAGLGRLAERELLSPLRADDQGQLRIIARPVAFDHVLNVAFNQIRQYARQWPAILLRLLDGMHNIAEHVQSFQDAKAIERQVEMIGRAAADAVPEPLDRDDVLNRQKQVAADIQHRVEQLGTGGPTSTDSPSEPLEAAPPAGAAATLPC